MVTARRMRVDAVIFDFDGVVVDSEPTHHAGFQRVLRGVGIEMSQQDYYEKYLCYSDRDVFRICAADRGVELTAERIEELIREKGRVVLDLFAQGVEPMHGAVELIGAISDAGTPLAICSMALREEIEAAARAVGVYDRFDVVTSAEDVTKGKPDPDGYELTRRRLEDLHGRPIAADRCVVFEDSPGGIQAANAAGMKVVAVTNTYPAEDLTAAARVVDSLASVSRQSLAEL